MNYLLCNSCGRRTADSDFADLELLFTASVAVAGGERREITLNRTELRVCTDCRQGEWEISGIDFRRNDGTLGKMSFAGEDFERRCAEQNKGESQ